MIIKYAYLSNGVTEYGYKIPNIPIVYLALRIKKYIARGPAIIDTGFDGGVYPNIEIIKLLKGTKPLRKVEFEHPLLGIEEFEVYQAKGYLYYEGKYADLGYVNIYVPVEPEFISDEVLIGREILNKLKVIFNPFDGFTTIEV